MPGWQIQCCGTRVTALDVMQQMMTARRLLFDGRLQIWADCPSPGTLRVVKIRRRAMHATEHIHAYIHECVHHGCGHQAGQKHGRASSRVLMCRRRGCWWWTVCVGLDWTGVGLRRNLMMSVWIDPAALVQKSRLGPQTSFHRPSHARHCGQSVPTLCSGGAAVPRSCSR